MADYQRCMLYVLFQYYVIMDIDFERGGLEICGLVCAGSGLEEYRGDVCLEEKLVEEWGVQGDNKVLERSTTYGYDAI